jgi:hypothetical protein
MAEWLGFAGAVLAFLTAVVLLLQQAEFTVTVRVKPTKRLRR